MGLFSLHRGGNARCYTGGPTRCLTTGSKRTAHEFVTYTLHFNPKDSPRAFRSPRADAPPPQGVGPGAVYVPLPTSLHAEWVAKAAAARRHVLLEKPVARNADELLGMLQACRAARGPSILWPFLRTLCPLFANSGHYGFPKGIVVMSEIDGGNRMAAPVETQRHRAGPGQADPPGGGEGGRERGGSD